MEAGKSIPASRVRWPFGGGTPSKPPAVKEEAMETCRSNNTVSHIGND